MPSLPSIFDQCKPRPEVLAGELPDAIFAADLWDVFCQRAHPDYQDAVRFFAGTHTPPQTSNSSSKTWQSVWQVCRVERRFFA
jgi:hypothetical protein